MLTIYMIAMPSKTSLFITFLLLLSLVLQLSPIFTGSVYFGFDQGLDQLMVQRLVDSHRFSLVSRYSGVTGVLMGPLWTFFLSIPFLLSNGNPAANILSLSVLFIISIYITYKFLLNFSKSVAVISIVFIFLSENFIDGARIVSSPSPLVFLFPIFLVFIYNVVYRDKRNFLIPVWLMMGIFFQLEIAFAIFSPLLLLTLLIIFKKIKYFISKPNFIGIGIFFATFLPQLIFDFRHDFIMAKAALSFLLHFGSGTGSLFQTHFLERIYSLVEDLISMSLFPNNWILSFCILIICLYLWKKIILVNAQWAGLFKLIIWTILIYYVGFSFYPGAIWGWYRAGLPIIFILLISIPLGYLWNFGKVAKIFVCLIVLSYSYKTLVRFDFPRLLVSSSDNFVGSLKSQKEALDYIYSQSKGEKFDYYAYTPPVYDYIWQYDFWWYGKRKYGYLPSNWNVNIPLLSIGKQSLLSNRTNNLVFLIIEPNLSNPSEPQNWEKKFDDIGTIIVTKPFPNGVVVKEIRVTN